MSDIANWGAVLYKYRNFENPYHMSLLEKNELFFSAPRKFNDPFDCDIPLTVGGESEEDVRAYFTGIIRNDLSSPDKIKALGKSEQEIIDERVQRFITDPESERRLAAQVTREKATRFGVYSLAQDWKNILMWAHYANCHTGYCVGLNTEKLKNYLVWLWTRSDLPGMFVAVTVKYSKDYPEIKLITASDEDLLDIFRVKYEHWGYEDEVRLLLHNGSVDRAGKPTDGTAITVDKSIIEEVVLGLGTTDKNREELIKILHKNSIKPKLYQLKKEENIFGLDRVEVLY